ncbi:MAG: response regulator [Ideonella sp.]
MAISDPAEAAAPMAGRIDDPSSLAWVHGELRTTLASAQKLLRRYLRESESHAGSDVSARELGSLRQARSLIHQAVGATTVIGATAATKVLSASEAALRWALDKPIRLDAALVEHIEQASFAVVDYLGRELSGQPVPALWMFPQMRVLLETAGAERVHPADLWQRAWHWREIAIDPAVVPRPVDERSLSAFEQLTLANIKTPSPLIVARISDLCAGLALASSGSDERLIHTVWQLAAAVFEALAKDLLQADVFSKRLASRLLSLLRGLLRGQEGNQASLQLLAHDLLFFCAQSVSPDAARPAPRLVAVRNAYALADEQKIDYLRSPLGSFDPALVVQARKRVASAKTVWSSIAGGEVHHLPALGETFSLVADSLRRLFPEGALLADQLEHCAAQARGDGEVPTVGLAMEVATALLYVEAALEESEFATPDPVRPIARLADRIANLRAGGRAQPLEAWIEDLYGRVADRQTLGTVVQELRVSMAAAEQLLDRYFRDQSDVAALRPVPAILQSMRGVLAVLGVEHAASALQHMRSQTEALLGATPLQPTPEELQQLAGNVGALGFLFDMLAVQPALAKAMFRFDIESGRLLTATDASPAAPAAPNEAVDPVAVPLPVLDDALAAGAATTHEATDRLAVPESIESRVINAGEPFEPLLPEPEPEPEPEPDTWSAADPELAAIFTEEAAELLQAARADLQVWRDHAVDPSGAGDAATLTALRRCFHTLKGSARMVDRFDIGELAWDAEQRYNARLADEPAELDDESDAGLRDWSSRLLDRIDNMMARGQAAAAPEPAHKGTTDTGVPDVGPFETTAPLLDLELDQGFTDEVDLDITVPGELDFDLSWADSLRQPVAAMPVDAVIEAIADPELEPDESFVASGSAEGLAQPLGLPPDLPSAADLDLHFDSAAPPASSGSLFWNDSVKPVPSSAQPARVSSEITVEDIGRSRLQPPTPPGEDLSFLTLDLSDGPADDVPLGFNDDLFARGLPDLSIDSGLLFAEPDLPLEPVAVPAVSEIDPAEDPGVLDLFDGFDAPASAPPPPPPLAQTPIDVPAAVDFVDLALDAPAFFEAEPLPPVEPDFSAAAIAFEVTDWPVPEQAAAPDEDIAAALPAIDDQPAAADGTAFEAEPAVANEWPSFAPAEPLVEQLAHVDPDQNADSFNNNWQPVEPVPELDHDSPVEAFTNPPVDTGWTAPLPQSAVSAAQSTAGDFWNPEPWSASAPEFIANPPFQQAAPPAWGNFESFAGADQLPAVEPNAPWIEEVKAVGTLQVPISLFNTFLGEADESSRLLCTELAEWAMDSSSPVPESAIGRAQELAAGSATVGFTELSDLARQLKAALLREQTLGLGGAVCDPEDGRLFSDVAEDTRLLLHQFAAGFLKSPAPELLQRLRDHEQICEQRRVVFEPPPATAQPQPSADLPAPAADWLADIDFEDRVDGELFPIFEEEAQDLLPQLASALREWAQQPDQRDGADAAMRHLHTFKGGARLTGAMRLGEIAHRLESRIEELTAGFALPQRSEIDALLNGSDAMQRAFEGLRDKGVAAYPATEARPIERSMAPALEPVALSSELVDVSIDRVAEPLAPMLERPVGTTDSFGIDWARFQRPAPAAPAAARVSVASQQASVRIRSSLLERMVNQAGEVNMSRARIDVEMGQVRGAIGELGANVDRLRQQLHDIELQAEMQMSSRNESARAASAAFDPLEIDRFTRLQELARMMTESVNDVATVHRSLKRNLQRTEDELAAQTRLTRDLQSDLLRTRMVEFDTLAERLHRVVRQAAAESGKLVELQISDGKIELDRSVLDRLTPAFEHLLRNAVIHGLELPDTRLAAGKPATGHLQVRLHQQGNEVSIEVVDDGAGLDIERIRGRARELGEPVIDGQESELIFNPGFSTAKRLTESSGRGVGLDVVRNELLAIDGQIEVSSSAGQGCLFSMRLPLTTATTQVLMLRCGDLSVAVPATLVERVRRVSEDELAQAQAVGSFVDGEHRMPFFWLGALLLSSSGSTEPFGRTRPLVVVHSGKNRLALQVDEVLGQQEAVVKNLGPQLSRLPGLAGMSMLASGAVALIYNPVALAAEYADSARGLALRPGPLLPLDGISERPPLILVVDDSLTVRRVTQRLLLREGFRVELAKDGIEALEQIAQDMPQLVLSDIEMPRMDGYELVEKLRANQLTADLPVVMITSRIADKHRVHAESLGVACYLGKPYGEAELLGAVRDCLQRVSVA